MKLPVLSSRMRLLLSAVVPAIVMMLVLHQVFLGHFHEAMERSFEARGMAIVRQIGAAAEYAIFSGSRDLLRQLAEGTRLADPAILAVRVMDSHGRLLVNAGSAPRQGLPLTALPQIMSNETVTVLQIPIQQTALLLHEEADVWQAGEHGDMPRVTGYIQVEISREELADHQRKVLQISALVMLGGLLFAGWLSLRMAGGVFASLDAAHAALHRQKEYAELLARTDALTGLANRRAFDEVAIQEVQRARRYATPLALVMTDLDHFKMINDCHGHHVGDLVLKHFAKILLASVRNIDLVGRWGGEEFVILMPGTDLEEAARAAERMRQAVLDAAPPLDDQACAYTASFGVAAFRAETPTMDSLLGRADAALYRAKENGRNRVETG